MKTIKIIASLLSTLFLVGILMVYFFSPSPEPFSFVLNKNTIDIQIQKGLDKSKIKIDLNILSTNHNTVSIFDSHSVHTIPEGYGENDWHFSYENQSFGIFRHFKTNWWHDHHYSFHFYQEDDIIKCAITIQGSNAMTSIVALNLPDKTDRRQLLSVW